MNKSPENNELKNTAFFRGISDHFKLVWALWIDPRINPLLKLLPLGSILYFLSPLDMVIPIIDDLGLLWFLTYLFIELSPEEIVAEHRQKIINTIYREWKEADDVQFDEEDIQDAEFTETN
ncbi:MAG: hypothetical protein JW757_12015 [Anaerolineales bacterium]|nr:hypothetical protein [Anaerolineales bacterium]